MVLFCSEIQNMVSGDVKCMGYQNLYKLTRKSERGEISPSHGLFFASWLGDRDILIFDTDVSNYNKNNYIIDGDKCDSVDEFEYINGDFERWIDRLIVSQSSKYWRR